MGNNDHWYIIPSPIVSVMHSFQLLLFLNSMCYRITPILDTDFHCINTTAWHGMKTIVQNGLLYDGSSCETYMLNSHIVEIKESSGRGQEIKFVGFQLMF
jgi:hypothetical protein